MIIVNRIRWLCLSLSFSLTLFLFHFSVCSGGFVCCPAKITGCHPIRLPILFHTPFEGAHFHATFTVTANEFSFVWICRSSSTIDDEQMIWWCIQFCFYITHSWQFFSLYSDTQVIPCIKHKITKRTTNIRTTTKSNNKARITRLSRCWNANMKKWHDDNESKVDRLLIRYLYTDE